MRVGGWIGLGRWERVVFLGANLPRAGVGLPVGAGKGEEGPLGGFEVPESDEKEEMKEGGGLFFLLSLPSVREERTDAGARGEPQRQLQVHGRKITPAEMCARIEAVTLDGRAFLLCGSS